MRQRGKRDCLVQITSHNTNTVAPVIREHSNKRTPCDQGTFSPAVSYLLHVREPAMDICHAGTLSVGNRGDPFKQVSLYLYVHGNICMHAHLANNKHDNSTLA